MANRYGRTIKTSDPFGSATESDAVILQQWCEHTLATQRGTLRTAPDHGMLTPPLLAGLTASQRLAIEGDAKASLERGRKVSRAKATLVDTALGGGRIALALSIEVWPATGGPSITFTHAVDASLIDVFKGTA